MKKKVALLCILFAAVFGLHGMCGAGSFIFHAITTGTAVPDAMIARYYFVTIAMVALFYLPLSIWIHRLAKKGQLDGMKILSLLVVIVLAAFLGANAIAIPLVLALT